MARVLSRLDILLHANTANYQREMKRATDTTKKELKTVADYGKLVGGQLGIVFASLGSAVSISHIVQTADRMQDLASKVRINTQSMEEYNAVLHDIRKISTDYWTAIDGITDLYASSKRALDSLGASQREVLDFTRNITMAMSIGGGSAQAQEAALIQLGQAMNMGMLRGQEFNSVSAQAPVIIDLLTESLKVSRGELRQMAKEGKITSQVMKDAVLGGYDKLQNIINQMPTTFAQGLQNVKSQYDFLVDDIMNQNSLISQNLANVALWVAENFRTLVGVGATMGAVWLTNVARNSVLVTSFMGLTSATLASARASIANAFSVQGQINAYNVLSTRLMLLRLTKTHYLDITKTAIATSVNYARSLVGLATSFNTATAAARLHTAAIAGANAAKRAFIGVGILTANTITGIGSAFASLGRIILAHPIITLTAVIGAVIARTEGLDGAIKSLGDAFNVTTILAGNFINGVVDGLGVAWTAASNYFSNLMGGADKATSFAQTAFGGFFANTEKGFVGVGQIIARTFDLGGATVVWFVNLAGKNLGALGTAASNVFKGIGNFAISIFERLTHDIIDEINDLIKGFSAIREFLGGSAIPLIGKSSFGRLDYGTPDFGGVGDIASYNQHGLENAWVSKAQELANASKQAAGANLNLAGSMANVADAGDKAGKKLNKANKALKDTKKNAEDANKAVFDLAKTMIEQLVDWNKSWWLLDRGYANGLLGTETAKFDYEANNPHGKFFGLDQSVKAFMSDVAKTMDELSAGAELLDSRIDDFKKISLAMNGNGEYQSLKYDLYNDANPLSLAAENVKQEALFHKAQLEVMTEFWQLQDKIKDARKELEVLDKPDNIIRQLFVIEQDKEKALEKYVHLLNDGYHEQYALIQQQTDALEFEQKKLVALRSYHELVQSLKSDEDKRLETLSSQLDILKAQKIMANEALDIERAKQLISQSVGLAKRKTDHYGELAGKTANQFASLDAGLQTLLDGEFLNEQERNKIKIWGADERLKIEKAHQEAMHALVLSDGESIFSSLASITKDGLGEQSKLYRAMFAMQQGFAIAQASIAMSQAMSAGLSKGFPLGLADMAMAAAHGAKIISAIKSVVMPVGQAHDGIMSVPKSGTWNLEKGERVLPRHTAQNLDHTLANLQDKRQGETKIIINNYSGEKTDVQQMPNGDMMVTIGKMIDAKVDAKVNQRFLQARRQGGELYGR